MGGNKQTNKALFTEAVKSTVFFLVFILWLKPESIEWFIEVQAFSPSHDLAPPPPLPPLSVSKLSLFLILPVYRRSISHNGEKAWSSINHSMLSD
jgi:hypothetical protein